MAGIITHLAIADKILEKLPEGEIKSHGLFYCGNIAPDGIHARVGYVRAHKKHTHMRDEIPDMDFLQADNLSIFNKRVVEFITKYYNPDNKFADLYKGYISHVLTDRLFMENIREDFVKKVFAEGIHQNTKEFYIKVIFDIENNDKRLVREYPFKRNLRKELESANNYSITDYLSEQELSHSKKWVVNYFFNETNTFEKPIYYTYESALQFIDEAADYIIRSLSDGINYPQVFLVDNKISISLIR